MTLRDVCDVAYVLLAELLERQTFADRQIRALEIVHSGEGGELPSLPDVMDQWNAALVAAPQPAAVDDEQMRLRRALGVL